MRFSRQQWLFTGLWLLVLSLFFLAFHAIFQAGCIADIKAGLGDVQEGLAYESQAFTLGIFGLLLCALAVFLTTKSYVMSQRIAYVLAVLFFGFIIFWVLAWNIGFTCKPHLY